MQAYFRDAVGTDLPAIGAILRDGDAGEDSAPSVRTYRDALAEVDRTDGNYLLVAEYDRQIVAVLQLVTYRHLHERGGRTAHVACLRVADAYRTSGVGGMLLDHAAARAGDLGCRRIEVLVPTTDAVEQAFWERSGFVHLERGYVRPLD